MHIMKSRLLNNVTKFNYSGSIQLSRRRHSSTHIPKYISSSADGFKTSNNVPSSKNIQYSNGHQRHSLFSTQTPLFSTQTEIEGTTDTSDKTKESLNHCISLVQSRDRIGYLTTLLLPYATRSSIFAIRAFNIELASVKDNTSTNSSNTGVLTGSTAHIPLRIRFQFWREVLDQIYDVNNDELTIKYYTENNPIIHLLQESIYSKQLTRRFLEKMVDAREYDLDVQQLDTLQEVVNYGEETFGSLFYLSLECMNVRDDKSDLAASHLSAAYSIIQALQSTQFRVIRNELSIPKDIMQKYSLTSNSLFPQPEDQQETTDTSTTKSNITPELKQAIEEMMNEAKYHLMSARKMQNDIPKEGKLCLLLPAVVCMKYLDIVEKYECDIFNPNVEKELLDWKTMLYLGRTWCTGVL